MINDPFSVLTIIIILGISAEWLAFALQTPSILLLLLFGFAAGPLTGFINPEAVINDQLLPAISIPVALILFEGGIQLRIRELHQVGSIVRNLVTLGALTTMLLSAAFAHLLFGMPKAQALLLGAILVPSGPTVIIPLLRLIRPKGLTGPALRWEGILVDCVGAILAVLVFEVIVMGHAQPSVIEISAEIFKSLLIGAAIGGAGAWAVILMHKRFWVPDFLQNGATLMLVLGTFLAANLIQQEAGLLAVTLMGILLANQNQISIEHIAEFKKNLQVLFISALFVLLASRMRLEVLVPTLPLSVLFVVLLIVVVRPMSVWVSTLGTKVSRRERLFMSAISPRGIVAAAVASILALDMAQAGFLNAEFFAQITFLAIIGTVAVSSVIAGPLAIKLGLAQTNPQGVLFIGAEPWSRAAAQLLKEKGYPVLLVDTNWANITATRMASLPAYYGNILSEAAWEEIDLGGIGHVLALTANDEVNFLVVQRFAPVVGRSKVYQLPPRETGKSSRKQHSVKLGGRLLFGKACTHDHLQELFSEGAVLKRTLLTKTFDLKTYHNQYGETATPLFAIQESGRLTPLTIDQKPPGAKQELISMVLLPDNTLPTEPKSRQGKNRRAQRNQPPA